MKIEIVFDTHCRGWIARRGSRRAFSFEYLHSDQRWRFFAQLPEPATSAWFETRNECVVNVDRWKIKQLPSLGTAPVTPGRQP